MDRHTRQTGVRWLLGPIGAVLLGVGSLSGFAAHQTQPSISSEVTVTQIAPRYHLISDRTANLVLLTADNGTLVAGVQHPQLVAAARATLARLNAAPCRYVIATEEPLTDDYESSLTTGDGGWGNDGAITLIHERFRSRMARFGKNKKLSNALPLIGFSQVVQVYLAGEEIHMIHERRGYSDADLVVHFEREGVLFLANSFTTDGYPAIDTEQHGSLAGVIETAEFFLRGFSRNRALVEPIVPARGPVATIDDLQAYRDMLVAVRDRVNEGLAAGNSKEAIVSARPTREFDERWGHGPIARDRFVEMVYDSLQEETSVRSAGHDHS